MIVVQPIIRMVLRVAAARDRSVQGCGLFHIVCLHLHTDLWEQFHMTLRGCALRSAMMVPPFSWRLSEPTGQRSELCWCFRGNLGNGF